MAWNEVKKLCGAVAEKNTLRIDVLVGSNQAAEVCLALVRVMADKVQFFLQPAARSRRESQGVDTGAKVHDG